MGRRHWRCHGDMMRHAGDSRDICQSPSAGRTNEDWTVTDLGTSYYRIANRRSGKVWTYRAVPLKQSAQKVVIHTATLNMPKGHFSSTAPFAPAGLQVGRSDCNLWRL